jgi:hypothetical protein
LLAPASSAAHHVEDEQHAPWPEHARGLAQRGEPVVRVAQREGEQDHIGAAVRQRHAVEARVHRLKALALRAVRQLRLAHVDHDEPQVRALLAHERGQRAGAAAGVHHHGALGRAHQLQQPRGVLALVVGQQEGVENVDALLREGFGRLLDGLEILHRVLTESV